MFFFSGTIFKFLFIKTLDPNPDPDPHRPKCSSCLGKSVAGGNPGTVPAEICQPA
jgi:hypothetical protein